MSIIVRSNHTRIVAWVNRNPLVYCTIPLIDTQGYHTNTGRRHGSLGYNSVRYLTSRIGWVLKGIFRYRCRRDRKKLYNNYCYTWYMFNERSATPINSNLVPRSI